MLSEQANIGGSFAKDLFEDFVKSVPPYMKIKTVNFPFCYWFFGRYHIDKKTARNIMKVWVDLDLIELKVYHGVKLKTLSATSSLVFSGGAIC